MRGSFGADSGRWLEHLPELLEQIAATWKLRLGAPFENLAYNYVVRVERADGGAAVLKVGVPNPELLSEIAALRAFEGRGMVRLLNADAELGALLLEALEPGTPLRELANDDEATRIACGAMRQLHVDELKTEGFPKVEDWGQGFARLRAHFEGGSGPFPQKLLERAEQLFSELSANTQEAVLLHGDLHHWNILSAQRGPWLAIDPKGLIGEPAYEAGAWLRNPFPELLLWPRLEEITLKRVRLICDELGFEEGRVLGWTFAQAVLAAWWGYEDGDALWVEMLKLAERFGKLL